MISKSIEKHIMLLALLTGCGGGGRMLVFKLIPGPQGEQGAVGAQGAAGQDGLNGIDGINGLDGLGCSVTQVLPGDLVLPNGGAVVLCGASSALISNGANGTNGTNGLDALPTAYSIVAVIDPCGDSPSVVDEVFLKMANGTLVASFSDNANGNNTRLSLLYPGSFISTDGSLCHFSVDANNNIYNEHY